MHAFVKGGPSNGRSPVAKPQALSANQMFSPIEQYVHNTVCSWGRAPFPASFSRQLCGSLVP